MKQDTVGATSLKLTEVVDSRGYQVE
jgi:hypothetical protein